MRTKFIMRKSIFLLSFCLLVISCSTKNNSETLEKTNLNSKQKLVQETAILLGKLLTDSEVKNALNNKMKEVDKDANIVSFAYLLEQEEGLRKNEQATFKNQINNLRKQNIFKNALRKEFENNSNDYKTIKEILDKNLTSKNNFRSTAFIADELTNLLVSQELQIFFPFDPEYENDDQNAQEYYVSFDPLNNSQTNIGFQFNTGYSDYEIINNLDNNFLDNNPVYVIVPIDPCDIAGRPCNFIELLPTPLDQNNELITSENQFMVYNPSGFTNNNNTIPTTTLLTTNTNHNNIPETDGISSYIPRIRINGTGYMGFGGTHQKLRFYRGTTDGSVTQNADGTITASPKDYIVKEFRCKRKHVKDKNWVDFGAEFDQDWNMSENTQDFAIFSIHNLKATASFELSMKSGFKLEDGKIKPNAEASGSAKINVSVGNAKFRTNAEISRRIVLATIVGLGATGETVSDGGVDYNVKKNGIVDYYFKHYYTDL
ncbi:hypothetical protein SAMN04488062_13212 [Flavobacterium omnivorum]|uniref:Lipoprotein n=1 Tax=Flavobacterium omnivorum TaxID=178355 RepID=A0A1G8J513_9FLAO|nr:hypothetical protein [Flavobacterium omnivorum]SDI26162.1 hypothetical protein SAMN04488062_13212 [Flavobacterium omnivorum]